MKSQPTQSYFDEIFCGSDDGDPDARYWMVAKGRSAREFLRTMKSVLGDWEGRPTACRVKGHIEETSDGPYFHKDPDGAEDFWEWCCV